MNFSDDQKKVIEARNCNILVSAAAGSGKTAVLVERIIQLVLEGTDIDRLLVVTFTKAAASEMRERISKALSDQLSLDPDNLHLQRQMTLIHNAHISTIDSFTNYILSNHFNDIGIDPAYRTGTDEEVKPILGEVLETLFEEKYAEEDEDFLDALECFSDSGEDSGLAERIKKLYEFADNYPFPKEWLREQIAFCDAPFDKSTFEESPWGKAAASEIVRELRNAKQKFQAALAIAEEPDGPNSYADVIAEKIDILESIPLDKPFFFYRTGLEVDLSKRMPSQKKDSGVDESKKERAKDLQQKAKDVAKNLKSEFFALEDADFLEDMNRSRHIAKTLAELTLTYMERATEAKRKENLLTFSDIAHLALSILVHRDEDGKLSPTPVAEDYRSYFKEIMIDEYQDSNDVQELILSAISGECAPESERFYNRFMVGDVKQSIYRFRQAKPRIFAEKYKTYKPEDNSLRRILLQRNYRSRDHVLADINSIFEKCMHKEVGNVEYDEKARLNPNEESEYPAAEGLETECLLLTEDPESTEDNLEQQARMIANRISRLMKAGNVWDKKEKVMRRVRFSDIAILSQSDGKAGWFSILLDVLREYGIPAHAVERTGYYSADEIRVLMNLLQILDNPVQDIPLFGVMRSIIGGFSDDELALIKASCKEGTLYDALLLSAEAGNKKSADFLQLIERYRKKTPYTPLRKLLQEIVTETGYREYNAAMPGGEQRAANIDMLLQKAGEFEKNGAYGLFKFIRYIDQLKDYKLDSGEANTMDEFADVVRIMTIHKSKGLEFPICFLARLENNFLFDEAKGSLLLDEELGISCEAIYPDRRQKRKTIIQNLIAKRIKREIRGEELRLLYVAMTRAKEKLIMTCVAKDPIALLQKQSDGYDAENDRLFDYYIDDSKNFLDIVLPCWERVTILTSADLKEANLQESVDLALRKNALLTGSAGEVDTALADTLRARFAFRYPHEELRELFTKTTVSELKIQKLAEENEGVLELFDSESRDAYVPRFARTEEKVSGSQYGSAMHLAMERMDFTDLDDRHAAAEAAKAAGDNSVNITKIVHFLSSPVGKRMREAASKGLLMREKPFMLGLPASEVRPEFPDGEVILIQGIIDAYWEEEDGYVILDYKTDHIEDLSELPMRYRTQLDHYARALSEITGKPVKERILYSFCLDNAVTC